MPSGTVDEIGEIEEMRDVVAREIGALSDADLLRLKALARLRARGLPGVEWADLLNETILRVLNGSRRRPPDVPLIAFLAWTMRSICDEHWRRVRVERRILVASGSDERDPIAVLRGGPPDADPERAAAAAQMLAALYRLFARDQPVFTIIVGLANGLSAAEIRDRHGLSEKDYNTARKRMRRVLLRNSLGGLA